MRETSEQLSRIEDLPQKENIDGSPHRFVSVLPQLGSNPVQRSSLSQGPKNPLRWQKFSQDAVPLTPSFFHCSGVPEILQSWFFIAERASEFLFWWSDDLPHGLGTETLRQISACGFPGCPGAAYVVFPGFSHVVFACWIKISDGKRSVLLPPK